MNNSTQSAVFNLTVVPICSRMVRCLGLGRIITGQLTAKMNPFVLISKRKKTGITERCVPCEA